MAATIDVTRTAIMMAAILPLAALLWWLFRRIGLIRTERPFRPLDVRSWPLPFMLAMSAAYVVTDAVAEPFLGAPLAGVAAIAVMLFGLPLLVTLFRR